jgi:hypothetical protein
VSFVYLHAGTPFERKGELQMALPKMDIPVGIVEWEIFVPDRYSVRTIGGNVIDRRTLDAASPLFEGEGSASQLTSGYGGGVAGGTHVAAATDALPGQIRGVARDLSGAVLPGVTIVLDAGNSHQTATTSGDGSFALSGVPSGPVRIAAQLEGFMSVSQSFTFDQQPRRVDFRMAVGQVAETVTVAGETPETARFGANQAQKRAEPSQNVVNLQRRAAGVLPVRVDVPRTGTSHQFVKPLVVDQAPVVSLQYRRR